MEIGNRPDRDEYLTHTLPSGRVLGYARYGVEKSPYPPVFYLYGFPGTRLGVAPSSRALYKNNLRAIVIDRPGFGTSSPHEARTLLSFADDVVAVADHLGIDKFVVVGVSGGAPYALACAYAISPERLLSVGLVAGLGPYNLAISDNVWQNLRWSNKLFFWAPLHAPTITRAVWKTSMPLALGMARLQSLFTTERDQSTSREDGPEQDLRELKDCLAAPDWHKYHFEELDLFFKPYGFELKDIKLSKIIMWSGSKDVKIPPQLGKLMHAQVPHSELRVIEGFDHSAMIRSAPKFIGELVGVEGWAD